jgi:hypothetical protein
MTWTPAFLSYDPITVTITREGNTVMVEASEFMYRLNDRSFDMVSQTKHQVATSEWTRVRTMLANIGFWQMDPDESVGLDGSTWTIEDRVGRRYHRVSRWSPRDTPFRRVGLELLRLGRHGNPESR